MSSHQLLSAKYPSVSLNIPELWIALDGVLSPKTTKCPECQADSQIRRAPEGGQWVSCPQCFWAGDAFELFQARTGIDDIVAASGVLKTKGIAVRKGADSPNVIQSYRKLLRSRKAFRDLDDLMRTRKVSSVQNSPMHTKLGFDQDPHRHRMWWCANVYEMDAILGEDATNNTALGRAFGLDRETTLAVLALPVYDRLDRLVAVGVVIDNFVEFRNVLGVPLPEGVMFAEAAQGIYEPWGNAGLIAHAYKAAEIHGEFVKNQQPAPPVLGRMLMGFGYPITQLVDQIPKRDWILLGGAPRDDFALAKRLNAKVMTRSSHLSSHPGETAVQRLRNLKAVDWWVELASQLEEAAPGWTLTRYLVQAEWCPATADKVFPYCTKPTIDKVREALATRHTDNRMELRKGYSVSDTVEGWVRCENGEMLADAVLGDVVAYSKEGRTWHRGVVRFQGEFYPFDTPRLRRDPVSVIETTLANNGVTKSPTIHPSIIRYFVDTALYFNKGKSC